MFALDNLPKGSSPVVIILLLLPPLRLLAALCHATTDEASRGSDLILKLLLRRGINERVEGDLHSFYTQIDSMAIKFTACGFFSFYMPYGAICTYVIVISQYNNNNNNPIIYIALTITVDVRQTRDAGTIRLRCKQQQFVSSHDGEHNFVTIGSLRLWVTNSLSLITVSSFILCRVMGFGCMMAPQFRPSAGGQSLRACSHPSLLSLLSITSSPLL